MIPTELGKVPWRAVMLGLLVGGFGCAHSYDAQAVEGTWDCSVSWIWDNDGEPVPCGVVLRATCTDGQLSSVGLLSLGEAQWDEHIEGTCDVEGKDLVSTRSSWKTVPKNDEARRFEQERMEGRSFSHEPPDPSSKIHSRILSFTETQLVLVGDEGRTVSCTRP